MGLFQQPDKFLNPLKLFITEPKMYPTPLGLVNLKVGFLELFEFIDILSKFSVRDPVEPHDSGKDTETLEKLVSPNKNLEYLCKT